MQIIQALDLHSITDLQSFPHSQVNMVWLKLEKPAAFISTDNLTGVFAPQIELTILCEKRTYFCYIVMMPHIF